MISIQIHPDLAVPIYLQICDEIEKLILSSSLQFDTQLPSVRELAVFLMVNPNTVVKAYQLLQEKNLIQSRLGSGFTVKKISVQQLQIRSEELMRDQAAALVRSAAILGFEEKALVSLLKLEFRKFAKENPR